MSDRQSVVRELQGRYKGARKKEKQQILNECCELTGYNRSYASHILKQIKRSGGNIRKKKRKESVWRKYDFEDRCNLLKIWRIMDCIYGKPLAPMMAEIIPKLEKYSEINLTDSSREKLMHISSATIDRLLMKDKQEMSFSPLSHTKPGALLKSQIPIRTFSEWNENRPGFVEIDLVGHEGGNASGDFLYILFT